MLMDVYLSTNVICILMDTLFSSSFFICDKYYHSPLIENYKKSIVLGISCEQKRKIYS